MLKRLLSTGVAILYGKLATSFSRRPGAAGELLVRRPERQIERRVQTDIALRWYLGLDLFDRVPDHSTVSQLRRRKPSFWQPSILCLIHLLPASDGQRKAFTHQHARMEIGNEKSDHRLRSSVCPRRIGLCRNLLQRRTLLRRAHAVL